VIGSTFDVRVASTTKVGIVPSIVPEVTGEAFVTGRHEFLRTMKYGIRIEGRRRWYETKIEEATRDESQSNKIEHFLTDSALLSKAFH
jgi:hypothetical protein